MLLYILLFIIVFILILWALKPKEKPVTFTPEDRAIQKELLESANQAHQERIIEMQLDDMGIKTLPQDNKS